MDEIVVSSSTSVLSHQPDISNVQGSQFVVVWNDSGSIRGQRFLTDGLRSGVEFQVHGDGPGEKRKPAVTGTVSGFVAAWIDESSRKVLIQRFAVDGTKLGGEIPVSSEDIDITHRPVISSLTTGDFVVSWTGAGERGIRAQVFRQDGTPLGGEITVNSSEGVHFAPAMTQLDNAGFVIAWPARIEGGSPAVHFQLFEPTGAKVGGEQVANLHFGEDLSISFISSAELDAEPGHWVAAYVSSAGDDEERIVVADTFGPGGAALGGFNVSHFADQTIGSQPAVQALPSQRFVVAWAEKKVAHVGDTTGSNVKASILSETLGTMVAGIDVNQTRVGDQFAPSVGVAVGEDGETVMVAWTDHPLGDFPKLSVRARILNSGAGPGPG